MRPRDVQAIADEYDPRPEKDRRRIHTGRIWNVDVATVDLGAAGTVVRELVDHPGAVAVLALNDADEVLLLRQYRHPSGSFLWEIPAGLLDAPGELPHIAAARELAEEADLVAATWHLLAEFFTTPGSSDESIRVYLARDVASAPEVHARVDEEADIELLWVPLADAVTAVLNGRIHNPSAVVGILALQAAKERGWRDLRPVDAPWPAHKAWR